MPADLKTARDHPAVLLSTHSTPGAVSGALLNQYEDERKVTFAALDNEALVTVVSLYSALSNEDNGSDEKYHLLEGFTSAVRDLLGLDDMVPEPKEAPESVEPDPEVLRILTTADDVTPAILEAAEANADAWFSDEDGPIDWEEFIDKMADPEGYGNAGKFDFDFMDSPAVQKIQKHVRAYRKEQ
jgi:hypothetical protein